MRASAEENPELFWGIRGGGGNFGVVTSFEYRLHEVGPTVLAGPVFYPQELAPEVLRAYRDFVAEAPDELTTIFQLRMAPPLPFTARRPARQAGGDGRLVLRRLARATARRWCDR